MRTSGYWFVLFTLGFAAPAMSATNISEIDDDWSIPSPRDDQKFRLRAKLAMV